MQLFRIYAVKKVHEKGNCTTLYIEQISRYELRGWANAKLLLASLFLSGRKSHFEICTSELQHVDIVGGKIGIGTGGQLESIR